MRASKYIQSKHAGSFFIYLAEEYQKLVEQAEESLYGAKQISLPTPQCIVFYHGEQDAPNMAISYCINHGILSDFLKKYRAEVLGMILEEFDVDKYERSLRAEGTEYGRQIERERINKLTCFLLEQNRITDLKRAVQDKAYQEELFREFNL